MSAIVGILNKQAIALAADSAVTIDGIAKTKIFNRANKIFTLSKHHPVGIMVYNAADFMSTPWEIIIKLYRKQLKEKFFDTLQEYQDDFLAFLKSKNFFTDEATQKKFLHRFAFGVINNICNTVVKNNPTLMHSMSPENVDTITNLILQKIESTTNEVVALNVICQDFEDYSFEEFQEFSKEPVDAVIQQIFTTNDLALTTQQIESVYRLIHTYLRTKEAYTSYTGLVFVGFGEEEIYPRLLPIFISLSIQHRLRYYVNEEGVVIIENDNAGAVAPFAQHDVMDMILRGIDDNLHGAYLKNFKKSLNSQKEAIAQLIEQINPALAIQIRSLDNLPFIEEYDQNNVNAISDEYIDPMLTAVSLLSKEDLAEMAESLIYLTYLKRRITFAEESVGGAVDVAIISKGDGFVWIKRKLYFDSKLNEHFIDNYLNS